MSNTFKKSRNVTQSFQLKTQKTILIDASNLIIGRLASQVATILRGKNSIEYTPNADISPKIIIINTDNVKFTSDKVNTKIYYTHTGYAGGIKEKKPIEFMNKGQSDEMVFNTIAGMMSKRTPLGRKRLKNLRIYRDDKHPHKDFEVLSLSEKNKKNILINS